MVDEKMRELQHHGCETFPVGQYEWASDKERDGLMECHWHDECEFFTIIEGKAYFSIDGVKTLISEGDVVFVASDCLHMAEMADGRPFQYRAVVFDADMLCGCGDIIHTKYIKPVLEKKTGSVTFPVTHDGYDSPIALFNRLFEFLTFRPPVYELRCKALLLELMALVFSQERGDMNGEAERSESVSNIKKTINYIHKHYASNLTVSDLAQIARMSDGHFSRQFKVLTSRSPIDYVKWVRLVNASKLVSQTNEKLICIAIETGFNSVSYFTRSFNSYFGLSPAKYRKMNTQTKGKV